MKKRLSLLLITFFSLPVLIIGQEAGNTNTENRFSVFIESPFFYKDWWEYEHHIVSVNFEYLLRSKNNPGLSLILGYGEIIEYYEGAYYLDPYIHTEITKLFGRKNHFFELGGGGGYASSVFLNLRLGYRLELGKRFLFRTAFTPALYPRMHIDTEEYPAFTSFNALSVSLGYRFGQNKKDASGSKYRWFSGFLTSWQPGFKHYYLSNWFSGSAGFEFIIAKLSKVSLNPWIAYYFGTVNGPGGGFRAVYGQKTHFLETGIGFTWYPEIIDSRHCDFFTFQPELGYRIHLWKRFMARATYTPYWWLADKIGKENIENKFVNSFTIGVGLRLH